MVARRGILVTDHAVSRYLERAFPHHGDPHSYLYHHQQRLAADPLAVKRLLAEEVRSARAMIEAGEETLIVANRMGADGHLYKHYYLRFVTPQRIRVFIAVDEKLRKVYTILTLDQFINTVERRA
jgi:hypothetical protein